MLLGKHERLDRVWDSGSDHGAELAEINTELVDITGFVGTPGTVPEHRNAPA